MATDPGPIIVEEVPAAKVSKLVDKGFKGYKKLVSTKPHGIIMSPRYAEMANDISNFEFRPDDIIVMTYPKSGTTWLQETIWAMRNIHQLHLADKEPITTRSFFIDADGLYSLEHQLSLKAQMEKFVVQCPGKKPEDGIVLQLAAACKTPRIIKTHLPITLYPRNVLDNCKIVYVCRDPRDICVSYYHHCRLIKTYQFEGTFKQFSETFMDDDLFYGSYWDHVSSSWRLRHHENLHFVFYEDLKKDPVGQLKLLDEFLGIHLSEEQLKRVVDHSSFENMKNREKVAPMTFSSTTDVSQGNFFRKGIVGDWKNLASASLDQRIWEWMKKQAESVGMEFEKYEKYPY